MEKSSEVSSSTDRPPVLTNQTSSPKTIVVQPLPPSKPPVRLVSKSGRNIVIGGGESNRPRPVCGQPTPAPQLSSQHYNNDILAAKLRQQERLLQEQATRIAVQERELQMRRGNFKVPQLVYQRQTPRTPGTMDSRSTVREMIRAPQRAANRVQRVMRQPPRPVPVMTVSASSNRMQGPVYATQTQPGVYNSTAHMINMRKKSRPTYVIPPGTIARPLTRPVNTKFITQVPPVSNANGGPPQLAANPIPIDRSRIQSTRPVMHHIQRRYLHQPVRRILPRPNPNDEMNNEPRLVGTSTSNAQQRIVPRIYPALVPRNQRVYSSRPQIKENQVINIGACGVNIVHPTSSKAKPYRMLPDIADKLVRARQNAHHLLDHYANAYRVDITGNCAKNKTYRSVIDAIFRAYSHVPRPAYNITYKEQLALLIAGLSTSHTRRAEDHELFPIDMSTSDIQNFELIIDLLREYDDGVPDEPDTKEEDGPASQGGVKTERDAPDVNTTLSSISVKEEPMDDEEQLRIDEQVNEEDDGGHDIAVEHGDGQVEDGVLHLEDVDGEGNPVQLTVYADDQLTKEGIMVEQAESGDVIHPDELVDQSGGGQLVGGIEQEGDDEIEEFDDDMDEEIQGEVYHDDIMHARDDVVYEDEPPAVEHVAEGDHADGDVEMVTDDQPTAVVDEQGEKGESRDVVDSTVSEEPHQDGDECDRS